MDGCGAARRFGSSSYAVTMIMGQQPKILGIIPARGGSKGLPGKNIRLLGGKPLIAWTIEAANKSKAITRAIVTSDDECIIAVARQWGGDVPFVRPAHLSDDSSNVLDAVLHAIANVSRSDQQPLYDYIVLLQPTCPLREAHHIDAAVDQLIATKAPACVSVSSVEKSPYWMYQIQGDGTISPLLPHLGNNFRRQDTPPVYILNGAIYVICIKTLQQTRSFTPTGTVAYHMPGKSSYDIDTLEDFERVERSFTQRG